MNKNHFVFGYAGNKRREVGKVVPYMNLEDVTTIVEPFCGSSALSCYLSQLYPNRFIYRLNDNDERLIELYYLLQCPIKTKQLEDEYNECIKTMNKEIYDSIVKEGKMLGYVLARKHYFRRIGQWCSGKKISHGNFCDAPIVKFLRTETVEISNIDGEAVMKEYIASPTTIIYLDPPYLKTANKAYYAKHDNLCGIYKYLESYDIKNYKCQLYLHILENAELYNKIKFNFNLIYSDPKLYGWGGGDGKIKKSVIHQLFKIDDTDFVRL